MKFSEIISRLTGFSCPIFGVSWNPPEPDVTAARRVITFLEDRRVLFVPSEVEVPHHCIESVQRIRDFLTDELSLLNSNGDFSARLRAMRTACRKFLDRVQNSNSLIIPFANQPGHWASWVFNDALGQMRGVFGIHIAQLAVQYGLDVEDDLAVILPDAADDGN